jgi:hypothetical protein
MDRDHHELEVRAYLALQGASGAAGKAGDWRNDVAAALRSNARLSPEFREALASAIDGDLNGLGLGFRLELVADHGEKKRRQDRFGGKLVRREWMSIGKWMADKIASGSSRANAITSASDAFAASREKCDAALVYFTRATRWLATVRDGDSELGKALDDESLIWFFHSRDAAGMPMDRQPPSPPEMK